MRDNEKFPRSTLVMRNFLAMGLTLLMAFISLSAIFVNLSESNTIEQVQKQILKLLIELKQKENLSFILICHDLALVQAFCDKVLVLYHGKTVEYGTPDEIINHPKMDYTKKLIDSVL